MTKLQFLIVTLAVSNAVAASLADGLRSVEKRQSSGGKSGGKGLGSFFSGGSGGLSKFLGEPEATEVLSSMARMLGATKTSPGIMGSMLSVINQGYGLAPEAPGAVARKSILKSKTGVPGAETVKIRYGPYKVPSGQKRNMMGQLGMLFNYPHLNLEKPCQGNCTLLGMTADLEYADGKTANINEGLWLHHLIIINSGPGREDYTCRHRDVSLPHVVGGASSTTSERIFASGNERTSGVFPDMGVKDAGYKLRPSDKFSAVVELMNENAEDKVVYLTMTYDFINGHPFKDDIQILWFDVRQCGTSEVNPPKGKAQFTLDYKWNASFDGEFIGGIGHLHDGGTRTTLTVDGRVNCENAAKYGTKPGYVQSAAVSHSHGATSHISEISLCYGDNIPHKQMRKGQEWRLQAYYDFDKNKGVMHADGSLDEVMGIALVYVRRIN